jgi:hypothetical protein
MTGSDPPHTPHRAHRLIEEEEELSGLHCERERVSFLIYTLKKDALPVSDQLIHSVNEIFFLF